jgi:hypothetical protein
MADTIFTVTVPGGTGGGYYIDGVQKPIIPVVTDGTFRFNQNDSTNNFHPLILSTTTSSGGIISTGVSYYLDGPSNESDYRNTSLFNAASVRYIEITVTQTSDFYYLCSVHGFSMGNNIDITVDTWGALSWNTGEYGEQNNHTEVVDSVSASLSIGSSTVVTEKRIEVSSLSLSVNLGDAVENIIDDGWGAQLWGFGAWGIKGDVLLTGQSLATSINSVTFSISAEVDVQGSSLQTITGDEISRIDAEVFPDGFSISTTTNGAASAGGDASVILNTQVANITAGQSTIDPTFLVGSGWGRDTFGNLGWGVNYSVIGGGVNGLQANIITGDEDAFTDVIVAVSGTTLQTAINSVGTSANSDHEIAASLLINSITGDVTIEGNGLVELTGVSTTTAIGNAIGGTIQEVDVQGVSINTFIGDEDITGNATVALTGVTATAAPGQLTYIAGYDVTGVTSSVVSGQVTITGTAIVIPTGIGLTISTINPNIIAWAEVDTGNPVNWTPVDLAA